MAENLSKKKRDRMISFLEGLKKTHTDDASICAFNEIENQLREKKYGLVWEEHSEEVDDKLKENIPVFCADKTRRLCKDEKLPWNFIIEGDNLQALYLLEKTHKGKVDCIYIDPPYNSGARDWKYNNDYVDSNDVYRHSKWLSMMKNRLAIAKNLLNPENSVLICTIDEKEYMRLGCLLEEMFPTAKIQMITTVINPSGTARETEFSRVEEYIYFVTIGNVSICKSSEDMLFETAEKTNSRIKNGLSWESFLRSGQSNLRTKENALCYPILIDEKQKKVIKCLPPLTGISPQLPKYIDGKRAIYPIKNNGKLGIWRLTSSSFMELIDQGYAYISSYDQKNDRYAIKYLLSGTIERIKNREIIVKRSGECGQVVSDSEYSSLTMPKTVWNKSSHNAGKSGSDILNKIYGERRFDFPKALYAVCDAIRFFVGNNKNATIVDFFAGSGTTGHAVNLLNAEDGGNRKWIMVTNNEISYAEEKEFAKKGIKKGDHEWEARGIAQYVTWPRIVCTIEGKDVKGNLLKGNYLGSNISMADGFTANVKYFKCDWTPRAPEDYLLSNALALHIKEMIEIQNAIEIDNVQNVLVLNKTDFKNTVLDKKKYAQIKNIWVNQNIIFNAKELKLLQAKGYKYIPKEFFGQELREAAE